VRGRTARGAQGSGLLPRGEDGADNLASLPRQPRQPLCVAAGPSTRGGGAAAQGECLWQDLEHRVRGRVSAKRGGAGCLHRCCSRATTARYTFICFTQPLTQFFTQRNTNHRACCTRHSDGLAAPAPASAVQRGDHRGGSRDPLGQRRARLRLRPRLARPAREPSKQLVRAWRRQKRG